MDRLQIDITGNMPETNKFAVLADAETEIAAWVKSFNERNKMSVTVTVRSIRPGKPKATPSTLRAAAE